ncbi:MAG: hypothetical protein HQL16_03285 [Candidatus Omnitrophica bacterium]|nr:hypothetical protein [Candidatus Omnitrophota bacterium]
MIKNIAHIVVNAPVEGAFDYCVPEEYRADIALGMRVLVSFRRRKCVGIVVGFAEKSAILKLNNVLALLDEEPVFPPLFLKFAEIFALRFGCSLGDALTLFLPSYLRAPKKFAGPADGAVKEAARPVKKGVFTLLFDHGLTQRWDILSQRIQETLQRGEGVICLVPDGSYVEGVSLRLRKISGEDVVFLSQGTDKEEFERWKILWSGRARVALGFISAAFAPVKKLGLLVVLDEESASYKHDQSPFYHAREAVFLRAVVEGADILYVSSAPSIEARKLVADRKVVLTELKESLSPVKFLDLTNFKMRKGTFLSQPLRQHLERVVKEGKKACLYIQASRGTESVVEEIRSSLWGARVLGYDKASSGLKDNFDILVTTQAVFRHRENLRFALSVVLDIDWEFHKADYRASHGAFLLVRYLRQMSEECVLLQTRNMAQELLPLMAHDDTSGFYARELSSRKEMGFPPYAYFAAVVVRSSDPQLACGEAKLLYDKLSSAAVKGVEIFEPQQDRAAIVRGKFRYCVMVRGESLKSVMALVKDTQRNFRRKKDIVLTVNVNP